MIDEAMWAGFIERCFSELLDNARNHKALSVRQRALWALAEICSQITIPPSPSPSPSLPSPPPVIVIVCEMLRELWDVALSLISEHDKLAVSALRLASALCALQVYYHHHHHHCRHNNHQCHHHHRYLHVYH